MLSQVPAFSASIPSALRLFLPPQVECVAVGTDHNARAVGQISLVVSGLAARGRHGAHAGGRAGGRAGTQRAYLKQERRNRDRPASRTPK